MLIAQNTQQNPTEKFTFAPVPNWLMRREELDSDPKIVYARLSQYAGVDGYAFPSRETLQEECGMSIQRIDRAIRKLNNVNLIATERRGKNQSNVYTLIKDHIWMKDARKYNKPLPKEGVIKSDKRELLNLITPYKDEKIIENNIIKQKINDEENKQDSDDLPREFDKWWEVYPRRQCRAKAFPAFVEARKHASFETLIRKAKSYARQRERIVSIAIGKDFNSNQDLYTRMPHTWLANHDWEEDYGRDEVSVIKPVQQIAQKPTKQSEEPKKKLTPQELADFFADIKKQLRAA